MLTFHSVTNTQSVCTLQLNCQALQNHKQHYTYKRLNFLQTSAPVSLQLFSGARGVDSLCELSFRCETKVMFLQLCIVISTDIQCEIHCVTGRGLIDPPQTILTSSNQDLLNTQHITIKQGLHTRSYVNGICKLFKLKSIIYIWIL